MLIGNKINLSIGTAFLFSVVSRLSPNCRCIRINGYIMNKKRVAESFVIGQLDCLKIKIRGIACLIKIRNFRKVCLFGKQVEI